jgi:hypothetical protein
MDCLQVHNLFKFAVIRSVALVVNPTCFVPSASHLPASACNQHNLHILAWQLSIHVPLDQRNAPMLLDVLSNQILAHGVVPHVSCINTVPLSVASLALLLKTASQVDIKPIETSLS